MFVNLAIGAALSLGVVPSDTIQGSYIEARTCDVFTGPCFANADGSLAGRHAVMGWKIDKGLVDGHNLDGLQIVAVVAASDTLGQKQVKQAKCILFVDEKADVEQRRALIALAQRHGGGLLDNVIDVQTAPIELVICPCQENACATLKAGQMLSLETRCLNRQHDWACGNESRYYEPLASGVNVIPAMTVEHAFRGKGFDATWKDLERRGSYVGTFQVK